MANINNGIINNYSIKPKNLTQYTAFRGVTDFTQIGQFQQFESGYSFLSVIQMPPFMVALGERNSDIKSLVDSFKHMLECEFRGMQGFSDISAEQYDITDGINTQKLINKVSWQTDITVSASYYEKSGGLISKFTELYLTGIKDKMTQAKTYHGLIKNGWMEPSPENEVFTMLYYVTDATMMRLERAILLCNCQLTTSRLSDILNSQRGDISNKETEIEWTCFPVMGYEVDKAANALLKDITGVKVSVGDGGNTVYNVLEEEGTRHADGSVVASLNSADYKYGIMDSNSPSKIDTLVNAINS